MSNPEKMLYQENKLGSDLAVAFITLNMLYTIYILNYMHVDLWIGGVTLYSIGLSLVGFLASTKYKVYNMKWAKFGIFLAVTQGLRLLIIPDGLTPGVQIFVTIVLFVSAVLALVSALITISRCKKRQAYISSLE